MLAAITTYGSLVSWLTGFTPTTLAQPTGPDVAQLLTSVAIDDAPACGAERREVYAAPLGEAFVLASYTRGVVVVDGDGKLIAWTGGWACSDPDDDISLVAVGSAQVGEPVIAVVTQHRHASSLTILALHGDRLDTLFAGEVTRSDASGYHAGSVTLAEHALVYVDPAGIATRLVFDGEAYVPDRPTVRARAWHDRCKTPDHARG